MGPPAWPLAMPVIASRCAALARSSTMTPTDQLPSPITLGVRATTAKARPSSGTSPYRPRATWNASAKMQCPCVGRAAMFEGMQGQR
jgi:hypothetical protein